MLLTIPEVAQELKISTRSVKRLLRNGEIPHLKISHKCVRIDESAFRKWVRRCQEKSTRLKKDTSSELVLKAGLTPKRQKRS